MNTKSYIEIKVPMTFEEPWFKELRNALKDLPVLWQKDYYHLTIAFIDDTYSTNEIEHLLDKDLAGVSPVNITLDRFDVFVTNSGMIIVCLATECVPEELQRLVEVVRGDILKTNSQVSSSFRFHITLGRIKEPGFDISKAKRLIDSVDFHPFTVSLSEIEYRLFRGKHIYRKTCTNL